MECQKCGKCGATWFNGQLRWATGAQGNNADLAGLVCDKLGDHQCINPARNTDHGGDTWAKRLETLKRIEDLSDR
jgi:hypothetical protein|tara:strand:- start:381 stop:605 length:225 start_codon:yes stop_codon:yes gene_type:complete